MSNKGQVKGIGKGKQRLSIFTELIFYFNTSGPANLLPPLFLSIFFITPAVSEKSSYDS